MQKTFADLAASSVSSLLSENIGLRYLYHRGSFLVGNVLPFLTRSLSLCKGRSRTAATSKVALFVIIVNGR